MAYFLNLFTEETWREIRVNASWSVTGHTESLRNRERISEGDIFICWVTGVSAAVGALRVTGEGFEVDAAGPRIWRRALFPLRYPTELEVRVPIVNGVTLAEVRGHTDDSVLWGWIFRNSGNEVPARDAEWILEQLRSRPQLGPEDDEPSAPEPSGAARRRRETGHPENQLRLAKIGERGDLDVWIAPNDRSTTVNGIRFGDLSIDSLPEGLPPEVRQLIGRIDVLWLKRNRYIAAFEIEASTPIFTGLQRMGDLIASLPNFVIPLFIVAPESKRANVFAELTRPLFSYGLDPPLDEVCRYISFDALEAAFEQYGQTPGLDPMRLVDEIAESAQ
jgi:hypothetical protein